MPTLAQRHRKQHNRLDELRKTPMEPLEYCQKWVPSRYGIEPDEHGYRKACVIEIAKVTGIAQGTVNNWGASFEKAPRSARIALRMADLLYQVQRLVKDFPNDFPDE